MTNGLAGAQADAVVSPSYRFAPIEFRLAQQPEYGRARPRLLGAGSWRAAKAAKSCAAGGTVLNIYKSAGGHDVQMLVGSEVVVVRVDQNGQCR